MEETFAGPSTSYRTLYQGSSFKHFFVKNLKFL